MKPENILSSDVLDILFEGRNKEYGAYALRKEYNGRLLKAMGSVALLVILFFVFNAWLSKADFRGSIPPIVRDIQLESVNPEQPRIPEPPKPPTTKTATIKNTPPVIVPDMVKADPPPDINELIKETAAISTITEAGDPPTSSSSPSTGEPGGKAETVVSPPVEDDRPRGVAEKMPEYPGGIEALRRFLGRNLQVPEDIVQPGQQVKVPIRFVVDKDGSLSDVVFLTDADEAFKKEILRVVHKMPKWTPGSQNGRKVPVYFSIPIIFAVSE